MTSTNEKIALVAFALGVAATAVFGAAWVIREVLIGG